MRWELLAVFVTFLALLMFSAWILIQWQKSNQLQSKTQMEVTNLLSKQNQTLLNLVMSKDVQAFSTLTALTNSSNSSSEEDYNSSHDLAELKAVKAALDAQGLGDAIFDDQTNSSTREELFGGQVYDSTVGLVDLGGGNKE